MVQYRRKPKINEKVSIGGGTPLQQYIFRLDALKDWTNTINIIPRVKTFQYKGKSHRATNVEVHKALDQLVNVGVLDKKK
jgi:hypothetical protein